MSPPSHSTFPDHDYNDHAAASIMDSLSFLMHREQSAYACRDYLHKNATEEDDGRVTPVDRQRVVDWCYEIVDHCDLSRETVAVAMNMTDRFMSRTQIKKSSRYHQRHEYQLLIMTALYVSIKIHEPSVFGSSEFAMVTHGTYTKAELEETELELLHGLEWKLCATTPKRVGSSLLELLEVTCMPQDYEASSDDESMMIPEGFIGRSTWNFLLDELSFQTENAVRDYFFTTQRSSTVAAASILNAIEQVNCVELMKNFVQILKNFDFVDASTLLYCRYRLRSLVEDNQEVSDEESSSLFDTDIVTRSCAIDEEIKEACDPEERQVARRESISLHQECCHPKKGKDDDEATLAMTCTSSILSLRVRQLRVNEPCSATVHRGREITIQ